MPLLSRLKRARLVRVLLVYFAASWVVVQAAHLFQAALDLPEWLVPVVIVLLLVGLVVVGATAWVQASPATDRREAAGEVPGDWQLDLTDLTRSIRRGRLPHLTWGRTLAGGAAAFLALAALAAVYMFAGGERGGVGPRDLTAETVAPGLAVLPFSVSGGEMDVWREGMVDLLSRNLDGLGGIRAIDSRTVLARWGETVRGQAAPDMQTTLAVASRTGARWGLVGTAVEVGSRIRVSADIYDVETGRRMDQVMAEGSTDSLLAMVDLLSVRVARVLLPREDPDLARVRLSSITTASPQALRAFLAGEAAYRRSLFEPAIDAYQRAVDLDPAFALAYYRLASARGWTGAGDPRSDRRRAYEHRERLPAREALLVEAEYRARAGALPSGVALLQEGVRRYPDDPEMWYQLGDVYLHFGPQLLVRPEEGERALLKAVELDPAFAPYHIHLVDLALLRGDSVEAARRLQAEVALAPRGNREVEAHRLLFDYLYGPRANREEVIAAGVAADQGVQEWLVTSTFMTLHGDKVGEAFTLASAICEDRLMAPDVTGGTRYMCGRALLSNGRLARAHHHMALMRSRGAEVIPAVTGIVLRQTGIDPSAPHGDVDALLATTPGPDGLVNPAVFVAGIVATEQGRTVMADSAIRLLSRAVDARTAEGDSLAARVIEGLVRGLEGHAAMAAGRLDVARRQLEEARDMLAGSTGPEGSFRTLLIWPLAELYSADRRYVEALRLYEALWEGYHAAPALLRRADIYDDLGDRDRARQLRGQFLALWSGADPDHPMVRAARRGLAPG
jgi:tetratricopeptide (TPR) repeat protein/TolB-like protein